RPVLGAGNVPFPVSDSLGWETEPPGPRHGERARGDPEAGLPGRPGPDRERPRAPPCCRFPSSRAARPRPCPSPAMSTSIHPRTLAMFKRLARGAGAVVTLIGGSVLAGWAFDVEPLKRVVPGMVAMNPGGTALAFLLGGVSLVIQAAP